ncbi:uncharacterized protein LOC128679391 [Plodia interpunctella]|uniref:uncharacterized protein LOC128679391 n=1 Tax=Plodia interpunctella TaxID=58824 RepID=UPI002367F5B8|nr:uncharacterized protein LOC128679391 [Plodia interpunctella]
MKGMTILILATYLLIKSTVLAKVRRKSGPLAKDKDIQTCEEIAATARFNPYSVLDDVWVVFYYWGPIMPLRTYKFGVPSKRNKEVLQKYLNDSRVTYPINWTSPMFVMTEKYTNRSVLLVQMGDRGEFFSYNIITKWIKNERLIHPEDLNFKQIDNGKYLAYIKCLGNETYMMSRPRDVPKKLVIQDVAAKMGYRGKFGKSYLYQGHRWAPIPEDDDFDTEMFYQYKYSDQRPYHRHDMRQLLSSTLDETHVKDDYSADDPRLINDRGDGPYGDQLHVRRHASYKGGLNLQDDTRHADIRVESKDVSELLSE